MDERVLNAGRVRGLPSVVSGSFDDGGLFSEATMAVDPELIEGQRRSIETDQRLPNNPLPELTSQEQMFVAASVSGASAKEASKRAGIAEQTGRKWLKDREDIQQAVQYYRGEFKSEILPRIKFDAEDAHHMYMEAFRNSGNATEQVKATDSLVKLHGLTERDNKPEEKEVNSAKQLENKSARELLRLANMKLDSLSPDTESVEDDDG